jgi:hypothetical protein
LQLFFDFRTDPFNSYLDAFLAMPIILTFLLWERRYLFKWHQYTRLTILEISIATIFVSFISELIFPLMSEDFIADWLDVLFYFLGSLVFYITINPGETN